MKTLYILGSLDTPVYLESLAYPRLNNRHRGCFTPDESLACRFESMTEATLCLFNLEADDPCARALNLVPIPIKEGDARRLDAQLSFPLNDPVEDL